MGPFTSIKDVIRALLRRWYVILLVGLAGSALSVWFALQQPKVYQAIALIQIEAPRVTESLTGAGTGTTLTADSQLDLIQGRVLARDSLMGVVERLGLFPEVESPIERVEALRDSVTIAKMIDPALAWRPDVQPAGLSITVRMGDPTEAAAVANELSDRIIEEGRRRAQGRAALTLDFFQSEEARVTGLIEDTEEALTRYREANAESLPTAQTAQREQIARLSEQRLTLERELVALAGSADRLREGELAQQRALLEQQVDLIDTRLADAQAAIDAGPEVERQIGVYERQLAQYRDELGVLTQRRTEASMTEIIESQEQSQRFEVLEEAIVPEGSVSTSRAKLALAGGVVSGALALMLALALEVSAGRIRTAAQLERQIGAKPVVVIPRLGRPPERRLRRVVVGFAVLIGAGATLLMSGVWRVTGSGGGAGRLVTR
ncbi:hypothetical protein [Wenxinia saemankumensis]|uniref:Uncharacterized protein involved in exopolysaccharide biosynthesis n=1 Tax=Wenxinia saemankumensis TaxID=1447782 RepID=A0A1M6FZK9_9RHOB|nr:hypothetical protein [Wenxinia saemankumensis]SHJ03054.1 Uncharacterized protein involved in exopolysaccharide biosynthesis [Wenxinia saemankumensis]